MYISCLLDLLLYPDVIRSESIRAKIREDKRKCKLYIKVRLFEERG